MATTEHKHPNYMAIFWYLAILTVVEIAVIYMPLAKFTIGVLLCALALGKATLVAMYFMHLKFETRTLGMVAVTPLVIATLLIFVLLPDGFAVMKKTVGVKASTTEPAKHRVRGSEAGSTVSHGIGAAGQSDRAGARPGDPLALSPLRSDPALPWMVPD